MLKQIKGFVVISAVLLFAVSGCKTIKPEYTTVDRIMTLKKGQSPMEVSNALGLIPYDIYHVQFGNSSIYHYKYKYKERQVNSKRLTKREGLTGGNEVFNKEANLYVLFDKEKLSTLVTDEGQEYGKELVLFENSVHTMNENKSDFIIPPDGSRSFRKLKPKEK